MNLQSCDSIASILDKRNKQQSTSNAVPNDRIGCCCQNSCTSPGQTQYIVIPWYAWSPLDSFYYPGWGHSHQQCCSQHPQRMHEHEHGAHLIHSSTDDCPVTRSKRWIKREETSIPCQAETCDDQEKTPHFNCFVPTQPAQPAEDQATLLDELQSRVTQIENRPLQSHEQSMCFEDHVALFDKLQ